MNISKLVLECIEDYQDTEPIFIEDIKKYIVEKSGNQDICIGNISAILNRLKNKGIIKSAYRGIYYKPGFCIFGEVGLDYTKLRELKYLKDRDGNIKGYITGAKLFNWIGYTTLVPNVTEIVTNECKNYKRYDEKLRTYIMKPKIPITNENYLYLQFLDILENKDNIYIEVEKENKILYNIIKDCNLDFEKIIKYAKETNNKKALSKLLILKMKNIY